MPCGTINTARHESHNDRGTDKEAPRSRRTTKSPPDEGIEGWVRIEYAAQPRNYDRPKREQQQRARDTRKKEKEPNYDRIFRYGSLERNLADDLPQPQAQHHDGAGRLLGYLHADRPAGCRHGAGPHVPRQLGGTATNAIFIMSDRTSVPYEGMPTGRSWELDWDDLEALRKLPRIEYISAVCWGNQRNMSHQDHKGEFGLMATRPTCSRSLLNRFSWGVT